MIKLPGDPDDEVDPGPPPNIGRPAKNYVNIHAQLPPEVKEKIDALARVLDCSQGEVIAAAMRVYIASFKP